MRDTKRARTVSRLSLATIILVQRTMAKGGELPWQKIRQMRNGSAYRGGSDEHRRYSVPVARVRMGLRCKQRLASMVKTYTIWKLYVISANSHGVVKKAW